MNLAQFYKILCTETANIGGVPVQGVLPHATGSRQNSASEAAVC